MGIAEMILLAIPLFGGFVVIMDDGNFERKPK